ncbi:MAG: YbaB/EbfC family nucleoid-associated protein [Hyphomicrobiaceae bacterium]|nr:YbaB/EbfC family nucleoid-associated protein [Hyphomicrobiaceae bacterium]
MRDIMGMMGKLQDMQEKMQQMQAEAEAQAVDGVSGGGLVHVTLSGKGEMRGLKIDPSLLREDEMDILEDLIVAAHNDAKQKSEAMMQDRMKELTAGLPIPPGMKLPF